MFSISIIDNSRSVINVFRLILQLVASFMNVINNCNIFIVQSTDRCLRQYDVNYVGKKVFQNKPQMRAVFYLSQEFFAKDEIKKTSFCRRKKELKEKFIFFTNLFLKCLLMKRKLKRHDNATLDCHLLMTTDV
jgi:hypothetical protein